MADASAVAGFPARLRARRHTLMLTQTELATHVGTTLRTIQRWETGERFPTPRFRRALCEALGVGYADLFASE